MSLHNVAFLRQASGFTQLAAIGYRINKLPFFTIFLKEKCYLCIRMGITVSKTIIWGDISSDIWLEIMFYGFTDASP